MRRRLHEVSSGATVDILAMSGTHSRPIVFDHTFVSREFVFGVMDAHEWLEADALKTVLPNPAALGVARAAIEELNRVSINRKQAKGEELAHELAKRFEDLRTRSYRGIDDPDSSRGPSRFACGDFGVCPHLHGCGCNGYLG